MKPVTHRQIQVYDRKVNCAFNFLGALNSFARQLRDFLKELPETFRLPYDGNEVLLPADQNAIGHLRLLMINIGSHTVLLSLCKAEHKLPAAIQQEILRLHRPFLIRGYVDLAYEDSRHSCISSSKVSSRRYNRVSELTTLSSAASRHTASTNMSKELGALFSSD